MPLPSLVAVAAGQVRSCTPSSSRRHCNETDPTCQLPLPNGREALSEYRYVRANEDDTTRLPGTVSSVIISWTSPPASVPRLSPTIQGVEWVASGSLPSCRRSSDTAPFPDVVTHPKNPVWLPLLLIPCIAQPSLPPFRFARAEKPGSNRGGGENSEMPRSRFGVMFRTVGAPIGLYRVFSSPAAQPRGTIRCAE